jgi:hypothetical protein
MSIAKNLDWFITKDILQLDIQTYEAGPEHSNWTMFRLLDDDGYVYCEGLATQTLETGFEPLDWARYQLGCTSIQYLNNGTWETL